MTSPSMPPRSMAIAPLARRERTEASSGRRPTDAPMRRMLSRIASVTSLLFSTRHSVPSW